ncbi:MAG TPA: hypothetical protein DEA18_04040, partial [Dehalococcoidia bacterium]|nr:hypothetical protein [Dehalococcoidia bacterium]
MNNRGWPVFRGGPRRAGQTRVIPAEEPGILWSKQIGDYVRSSPVTGDDGSVYVGSWDHKLYAVSADGETQWTSQTLDHIVGSPAVGATGNIYVGSYDFKIHGFDNLGQAKWTVPTLSYVMSSPIENENG